MILAVWDVGDTAMAFYNVIDVKFDGSGPIIPDWDQGGQINPTQNLNIGDVIFYTRVFDQSGENASYGTELVIEATSKVKRITGLTRLPLRSTKNKRKSKQAS